MRASISFRGIRAREDAETSSLRSPDPRRVERRTTRRPRSFEIRTGQNIRAAVRAHRGQRQPHVDGELRQTPQARAGHGLPPLRKDGGQMRPEQTKPRHVSPTHGKKGYRPAVEAVQRRQSTARDRAAVQVETGAGTEAFEDAQNARVGTSVRTRVPRRDASFETSLCRHPSRPTRYCGAYRQEPTTTRSTTSCDHRAARLHGSHSHGPLSSMPHLCCRGTGWRCRTRTSFTRL